MLERTKWFDVECDYGRAYNLKQLREILEKAFGKRVEALRVFHMGLRHRTVRAVVDIHEDTAVDFRAIQKKTLNDQGVILIEVTADGSSKSMQVEPEVATPDTLPLDTVSPSAVPITIEVVKQPATAPRRQTHPRPTHRRPAAA